MKLNSLVVKVTSLCNLNCSYCYVYNKGDKSYIKEPNFMEKRTVSLLLEKVNNHCISHNQNKFLIIFHGGEPLLAKKEFYSFFIEEAVRMAPTVQFDWALQTNGVLLDKDWVEFLGSLKIQIGISLDGTKEANKERVYRKNGEPAYNEIINGLENIQVYGKQGVHLLSVMNTKEAPQNVYDHFKGLNISSVSFLYPEMNYLHSKMGEKVPKVGLWMQEFFKIWFNDKNKNSTIYKPFDAIFQKFLGFEDLGDESIGRRNNGVLTIKTNGQIEAVDSLKICGDGFTSTSFNVENDEFNDVFGHSLIHTYYYAHNDKYLCSQCKNCLLVDICGGGQLAHRYSDENEFNNPSIYCYEIMRFYVFMQNQLFDLLPMEIKDKTKIEKINLEDVLS
nr:radical SAM protein [Ancylomarina sp. 16SWW S1-10-2]